MAGHSKWANIKHKKSKEDAKRGKAFTRLSKEITVVARDGGGDPTGNPRLRNLIDKARAINMPAENITRAIKKGTGELPGLSYTAAMYEGYGPNGIAVIVEVLTDNTNRTVSEMRRLFSKNSGSMGEGGSVSWMFEQKGVVHARGEDKTEDDLIETLLDYDISDITNDKNFFSVYGDAKSLDKIKKAIEATGLKIESAQLEWVAKSPLSLPEDKADKAVEFLGILDDHDDVQNVYTNLA